MYKHTFYYFLGNKKYPEIYILLLHIRIKNYIKCHSLREFLMHAQVVYNAALFQITGFQSFREKYL